MRAGWGLCSTTGVQLHVFCVPLLVEIGCGVGTTSLRGAAPPFFC